MRVLAWLLVSATAAAAPAPKAPQCVPDTQNLSVVAAGGKAIACWEATGDCLSLDDNKVVPRPTAVKPAAEVRDDGGKLSACAGSTCKPLGSKLAAAIAKARADADAARKDNPDARVDITVTTDLALVALDTRNVEAFTIALWNVAKDKELRLKQPAVFPKDVTAMLNSVEAVGKLAFAHWTDCAGPCTQEIAVDADGSNHSQAFEAGPTVVLEDGRYVVAGENGTITVLDHTGRHSGAVVTSLTFPHIAVVTGDEVVAVSQMSSSNDATKATEYAWVRVKLKGKPALGSKGAVPECPTSP